MNPLYISGRIKDKKRVGKYIHDASEELGINQHYTKYLEIIFTSKLDGDFQAILAGEIKKLTLKSKSHVHHVGRGCRWIK